VSLRRDPAQRNVFRIEIPAREDGTRGATRGWQVRVMRGGRLVTKFFRGLGRTSRAAALRHRDALLQQLGPLEYNPARRSAR